METINTQWGDGFLVQMSKDLQSEFPDIKGFLLIKIKYMHQWYLLWAKDSKFGQQFVAQNEKSQKVVDQMANAKQVVAQIS